ITAGEVHHTQYRQTSNRRAQHRLNAPRAHALSIREPGIERSGNRLNRLARGDRGGDDSLRHRRSNKLDLVVRESARDRPPRVTVVVGSAKLEVAALGAGDA